VDGINADGRRAVFVPDSARGRLYVLSLASHKLSLLARGMIRPVAAITWKGAVVVADEYANAIWRIGHRRTKLAPIELPDDLAVVSGHLIASSLAGAVWEIAPHLQQLSSAFAPATTDPQGLVADGPGAVLVADQTRNAIYRLGRLAGCL
jgi:streptogramin lyase